MKKQFYLGMASLTGLGLFGLAYFNSNYDQRNSIYKDGYFFITVYGAVDKEISLKVQPGQSVGDIMSKITISIDADYKKINKKRILRPGENLFIPFINGWPKIKIDKNTKIKELTRRGVKSKIAKKILLIFKEKGGLTWNDINSVHGVGSVTIKMLHHALDID